MTSNGIKIFFDETFDSKRQDRKKVVDTIVESVKSQGFEITLSPEEFYLTIDEAVTNGMEHGNKWDPNKKIHVAGFCKASFLIIRVTDEGNGFDNKEFHMNLKNREILGIRGRGIYIINQLCKPSWNTKGNEITLEIKLKV